MAKQAEHGISWTEETWNPIRGCSRVSEGCRHCYAERTAYRYSSPGMAYDGLVRIANGHPQWTGEVRVVEERMLDPLHWKRPRRIFVNSMSDLFHETLDDRTLNRIFAVMALTPQHDYQVLTKRAPQMRDYISAPNTPEEVFQWVRTGAGYPAQVYDRKALDAFVWPLPNVWLGVSVENQTAADERVPLLLQTPAAVRWISAEPLLGAIDLTVLRRSPDDFDRSLAGFERCAGFYADALAGSNGVLMKDGVCHEEPVGAEHRLDWVVVGGESGPGARPMHPEWARSLRDQCVAAGVAFHFKQWGEWASASEVAGAGAHHYFEDGATVRRVGKGAAGRELDGRVWDEYPAVTA